MITTLETSPNNTEDPFALDLRVVMGARPASDQVPCGTGDGCDPTCASACASAV